MYQLVQVYGMNDKVGQLAFPQQEGQWPQDRAYSESTAQVPILPSPPSPLSDLSS
jgi:ATP-dependent Zn protease